MKDLIFKEIKINSKIIKGLAICLHWDCGEGWDGEYDPDEPTDEPLLRFDIMFKKEFVDNGSYCTQLKATDNRILLRIATMAILEEAEQTWGSGFKKAMERMSWIKIEKGKIK